LYAIEIVCSLELDSKSFKDDEDSVAEQEYVSETLLDEIIVTELDKSRTLELVKPVPELDNAAELEKIDELDDVAELEKIDELEDVAELDRTDELDTAAELDETEELDDIDEDDLIVISTVKVM
jgi:S-DNA-T family DNA segregation ATPase FtsK/SpoIIIE